MGTCEETLLMATGGTIASVSTESGLAPSLSGESFAANVPLVRGLCEFDFKQVMNIDSTNMRPQEWLQIIVLSRTMLRRLYYHAAPIPGIYRHFALSYLIKMRNPLAHRLSANGKSVYRRQTQLPTTPFSAHSTEAPV